jgi:hypothetical protein
MTRTATTPRTKNGYFSLYLTSRSRRGKGLVKKSNISPKCYSAFSSFMEPATGPYLRQMNPFHILPTYFLKIHFNIIFPANPRSSCGLFPFGIPTKTYYTMAFDDISHLEHTNKHHMRIKSKFIISNEFCYKLSFFLRATYPTHLIFFHLHYSNSL